MTPGLAIAAVVIGGAALSSGKGKAFGAGCRLHKTGSRLGLTVSLDGASEAACASQIGRAVRWTPKWLYWRDLDVNAEWVSALRRYRQSDIICVDLGGRYEASLARVAGLSPN